MPPWQVGGHAVWRGRPFVTVEALLEAPEDGNAYAVVSVSGGRIDIDGCGTTVTSRTFRC